MKLSPKLLLALAFTLPGYARAYSQDSDHGQFQAAVGNVASASSSIPVVTGPSTWNDNRRVTRYATRFDGDHSLDTATVAEQAFAQYTLYTVRLQFASGAEQSIAVTAPPGGLQPEMRDMSGDSVPNDLVLTSKLLRSLFVVLVNDGHDHLTVTVSPHPLAYGDGRASGPGEVHHAVALATSGVRSAGLTESSEMLPQQAQEESLSPIGHLRPDHAAYSSSSGRAPPPLATE
jgi:hypothetical protein